MIRAAFLISLLSALLAGIGLVIEPVFIEYQGFHASWASGFALALGQVLWYWRGTRLSLVTTLPLLLLLGLMLASYLIPEHWISVSSFNLWAAQLVSGSNIDDWRPPELELAALITLTLSLLVRTRANLGAPLLQMLATLLLLTIAGLQLTGNGLAPLVRSGSTYTVSLIALLLLAQFIGVVQGWRHTRSSLTRALWPSAILAVLAIAFWYQQSSLADAKLRQSVDVRYQRMAERLSTEVHAHLTAMRRFADFWGILGRPPQEDEWSTQAERYYQDFRYFLNIGYVTQSGEISHVYPQDAANTKLVGMKVLETQRPNTEVLQLALEQRTEEQTGVMSLLQNVPGLIYYLPINSYQDGSPMGVAAMVVGLPLMAETLYHEGLFDKQRLYLGLWNDDEPLKEWPVRGQPGPWRVESDVVFGHTTLTLIAQPNRELLLSERSRQPSVSLTVGLVLAYLLYLVLFGRHQMALQHRSVNRSNEELRREVRKRTQLQSEVEWLARHDELTGVPNRRHFMRTIEACAEQTPLCVLLCDIDHFKSVNDQLGHQAGDQALVHLANLGQQLIPGDGMFARYGGEEFVVMLPNTDEHQGLAIAELLREGVFNSGLEHADGRPVSISIGVAVYKSGTLVVADLLHQADLALYKAKHNGRNRVELATDDLSAYP